MSGVDAAPAAAGPWPPSPRRSHAPSCLGFRNLTVVRVALSPASTLSLGFLTLGGFLMGVVFWGGFNTALEATNRTPFCVSCHEMRDNVYEELQGTAHFTNRSGVRAGCPDCHVPHEWTRKIARKMQA